MALQDDTHPKESAIVRQFRSWALPRLAELPLAEREEAEHRARGVDFDRVELVWLLIGVGCVSYVLRFDQMQADAMSLPLRYLIQFVFSVPLLILVVGPVFLRRARRGLDIVIAERQKVSGKEARNDPDTERQ